MPSQNVDKMRIVSAILLFFLLGLNGCSTCSVSVDNGAEQAGQTILADEIEANLMMLYNATADNRNALQEEANVCAPLASMRIFNNRNRTVNQNITIRHTLLLTHRPAVSNLIHHPIIQLVAFPKEYHVFRLRRILI